MSISERGTKPRELTDPDFQITEREYMLKSAIAERVGGDLTPGFITLGELLKRDDISLEVRAELEVIHRSLDRARETLTDTTHLRRIILTTGPLPHLDWTKSLD